MKEFSEILANAIVIVGGILGFNYIWKLRDKQMDSTFSYLTRLNVRLKYFDETLRMYKSDIMDRFIPVNARRETSGDRIPLVEDTIKCLSENAKETLKFLKDENEQMPAQKGWVDHFNCFVEFLLDCERLKHSSYFKWNTSFDLEKEKSKYYEEHTKNISEILKMVEERRRELEGKLFKKKNRKRILGKK